MVKVNISLLTFALATMGSALALPVEYERRSELDSNLYEREFVDNANLEILVMREVLENLYERDLVDLETREPFGIFKLVKAGVKLGVKIAKNKNVQHIAKGVISTFF